jgi:hypothetical protein
MKTYIVTLKSGEVIEVEGTSYIDALSGTTIDYLKIVSVVVKS